MKLEIFVFSIWVSLVLGNPVLIEKSVDILPAYRLIDNTKPHHYNVSITTWIHEKLFEFNGEVIINIEVIEEETSEIRLNSKLLTINEVILMRGTDIIENTYTLIEEIEVMIIQTKEPLLIGEPFYDLKIRFSGYLQNGTDGFYRSTYQNEKNETIWLASTQMQATEARSVFPCFDEPRFKSTFKIVLEHGNKLHALSNMPGTETLLQNNLTRTTFETTPIMSTFILIFVVSDFEYLEKIDDGLQYRVYTHPGITSTGAFALDTGIATWNILKTYFKADYPLPKLDQIAVPNFQSGAMENWGLVAYRPNFLLINENSTLWDEENVAATISHEFVHNYFGNLVSPFWWSELWLSESFASFYEYYTTHKVYPDWRMNEIFVVDQLQWVFWRDSLMSTFPMHREATSPTEINAVFNGITYTKGACVVRMMHHALTEEIFVNGLTNYFNKYAYKNVVGQNLYDELQSLISDINLQNIDVIFKSWVEQSGYPVLNVTRNYEMNRIMLSQKRFLMVEPEEEVTTLWWIPYNYVSRGYLNFEKTSPIGWLHRQSIDIEILDSITNDDWMLFNIRETGYYRVNYDYKNWQLLIDHLMSENFDQIVPINRAQLIDDTLNLARANQLDYEITFDLLDYLFQEYDFIPWTAYYDNNQFLIRMLDGENFYTLLKEKQRKATEKIYEKLGLEEIENEPINDKKLRPIIVKLACQAEVTKCLEETTALYQKLIADKTKQLPQYLRKLVYCGAMQIATDEEFQAHYKMLDINTTTSDEREDIIYSLACSGNLNHTESLIYTLFFENYQEGIYLPGEAISVAHNIIASGREPLNMLIKYINLNFLELNGLNRNRLIQIILNMDQYISTQEQFELYDFFLKSIELMSLDNYQDLAESKAVAQRNIMWREKSINQITEIFKETGSTGGSNEILNISFVTILIGLIITTNINI